MNSHELPEYLKPTSVAGNGNPSSYEMENKRGDYNNCFREVKNKYLWTSATCFWAATTLNIIGFYNLFRYGYLFEIIVTTPVSMITYAAALKNAKKFIEYKIK